MMKWVYQPEQIQNEERRSDKEATDGHLQMCFRRKGSVVRSLVLLSVKLAKEVKTTW